MLGCLSELLVFVFSSAGSVCNVGKRSGGSWHVATSTQPGGIAVKEEGGESWSCVTAVCSSQNALNGRTRSLGRCSSIIISLFTK